MLYRWMYTSRQVDRLSLDWVRQGLAFFHASSLGHESTAALARYLTPADWLHLHYRDKTLLLARGMTTQELLRALLARGSSQSQGRQMSSHFSERSLNVLSQTVLVGNQALQAVGIAAAIRNQQESPIVVCSVGDGTTQQGEFLEAVAEAVRW